MDINAIIVATVVVAAVGLFIGIFLGVAGKKFAVEVDETVKYLSFTISEGLNIAFSEV